MRMRMRFCITDAEEFKKKFNEAKEINAGGRSKDVAENKSTENPAVEGDTPSAEEKKDE
jgi:hypothetical protein